MAELFDQFRVRDIVIPNRICVSPMSQYAATHGYANDWHFSHLSRFALGGCGLIFTEATAIQKDARRTHGDLGLWTDGQIARLRGIAEFIRAQGAVPGVQLAHAGRKASERRPWHGETPVDEEDIKIRNEYPWQGVGPTVEPYADGWPAPKEMTEDDIEEVIGEFGSAAKRADMAEFDVIEVYAAHGFLLHQFYSPLSNTRTDKWGGDFAGRIRLPLEVASSIRKYWPEEKPLFFRISATDWVSGGWDVKDSVKLAKALKERGVDLIDCSSGGIGGESPAPKFPLAPAFQADLASVVRWGADISTMSVGLIWDAKLANELIESGKADMVALARELLSNPNWALHAAAELNVDDKFSMWKPEFGWWLNKRDRVITKLGLRK
ncbi:MAG: NADH:flavin oxidoreductase/NADH oxidase [Pseudomonadota bacterium]